jgi:hypothetical protein
MSIYGWDSVPTRDRTITISISHGRNRADGEPNYIFSLLNMFLPEPPTVVCDFCRAIIPHHESWASELHTACDSCFQARKGEQLAKEKE